MSRLAGLSNEIFAAARWSRLALSGHSRHRNILSAFGQERTTGDLGIGAVCPLMSSRPEESHPRALPDPCVNLSIHTAPDVQPLAHAASSFTSSTGSSCCQLASVGPWPRLNNAAPSLQPHYRTFITTTGCSAPVLRIGTLVLTVLAA
jgi:hypothetical protein